MSADRAAERLAFAQQQLGASATLSPASSDASFRSYWRVHSASGTHIVMDAPPAKEDCRPFIEVAKRLRAAGLNAPDVQAQDLQRGFLLLSDLGTRTYLPELDDASADALYQDAFTALARMQSAVPALDLPLYDAARLRAELDLFPQWFLQRHLGLPPETCAPELLDKLFEGLIQMALAQPQVFVHRDYHSRNLMIVPGANPGILDFQDAVLGPLTYDLVSLLRDCYIAWPEQRVATWLEGYRLRCVELGFGSIEPLRFRRWFDWMGVQRHLKVLGIFARLNYRDGKSGYLRDLPQVLSYVLEVCERYPELQAFANWLRLRTEGLALSVARL